MDGDPRVRGLIERILETSEPPEVVCRDTPELLAEVRAEWRRVQPLRDELAALFPAPGVTDAGAVHREPIAIPGHEIEDVLGRGGMGIVYRARHRGLNRTVALKMMLGGDQASPIQLARFRREAELVASLRHPNIVQVYDVGEVADGAWFSMEYVGGGTLANGIRQPKSARDAATLVATLATATQCAHDNGVVHRDLKPSNVLLADDGTPRISDFGLARHTAQATLLTLGGTVGTPNYMAPEQVAGNGGEIGPAVDIHALGAILYELLAGQPPFRGETVAATLHQVLHVDPTPPCRLSSRVPRDLETIALKCLAKEPARRYARAADLADDLRRFLRHEPVRARRLGPAGRALRWSRRHPAAAALIALLGGALCWSIRDEFHAQAMAARQRAANAVWAAQLDRVDEALAGTDMAAVTGLLDELPDGLPADLRARSADARADLQLVRTLEDVRAQRSAIVAGRFDLERNREIADDTYARAFADTAFGVLTDDTAAVADRVARAPIQARLVAAIDDWAMCCADRERRARLLSITRRCDPDPGGWRDRVRDPDRGTDGASLQSLADAAPPTEGSVQLLTGLGDQLRRSDVDARPFLARVQQAFPADYWANYLLGETLRAEQPAEAVRYFQAAVAIRPQAVMARLGLGYALLYSGRAREALPVYQRAIALDGGVADAHSQLGMCLSQAGDKEAAVAAYRESIRLDPRASHVHQNLGNVLVDLGRLDDALAEYREAVRLEPWNVTPNYSVAVCLHLMGRDEDALAAARALVEMHSDGGTRYALAISNAALGRLAEAETEFRRAIELAPDRIEPRQGLRNALLQQGRHGEALAQWRQLIADEPANHDACDGYAELCLYLGLEDDYAQACSDLLARFGDSDDPHVCERTGRACLLSPRLPAVARERAAALLERAVHADPTRYAAWALPYFHLAQALARYRLGRYDAALELLRGDAAGVLGPAPALVAAMAQARLGHEDAARAAFTAATRGFDWSPDLAIRRESWIYHVLRREAAAMLVPDLPELVAGRRTAADPCESAALQAELAAARRR